MLSTVGRVGRRAGRPRPGASPIPRWPSQQWRRPSPQPLAAFAVALVALDSALAAFLVALASALAAFASAFFAALAAFAAALVPVLVAFASALAAFASALAALAAFAVLESFAYVTQLTVTS